MTLPDAAGIDRNELARMIDHTVLRSTATRSDILAAAELAAREGCAALCVAPYRLAEAAVVLTGTATALCTVIGFPFGDADTDTKVEQTRRALRAGAREIDVVLHLPALVDGDHAHVAHDLAAVRDAADDALVKVIVESAALSQTQLRTACLVAAHAGADFVKTSTGYHPRGGASTDAVALMARTVPSLEIKASGGITTLRDALALLDAGATRLGMSATAAVLDTTG